MSFKQWVRKNSSLLVFVFILLAVRWSFADQYHVPTGSMEPTIHVGDRIFVNKLAFDFKLPFTELKLFRISEPKRGDIIVFESPEANQMTLVKRLIGVPGDEVSIDNGFVSINGNLLDKKFEIDDQLDPEVFYDERLGGRSVWIKRTPNLIRIESFHFSVPADQYFMMGDNRDNSNDSRYWGFAPRQNLKGKALRVLFNLSFLDFKLNLELDRIGKSF